MIRVGLALLLCGCLVEVDYGGTRFRCAESDSCPEAFVCSTDGFCEPPGDDTDASVQTSGLRLTLDNTGRAALAGFPVPVFFTAAEIDYADAGAAGETVRFFAADDQTLLPHQIDTWDPAGTSLLWVRVDLPADDTVDIITRWGDPEAPAPLPAGDAFDDAFVAVWHLDDDPASGADGAILDDSGADRHGTASPDMDAASLVAGPLGGATHFAEQAASFGDLDAFELPVYSWSAWIRADADPVIGGGNAQPIFNADDQFNFSWDHNLADFAVGAAHRDLDGFSAAQISTAVAGQTWYLVAATYDGTDLAVYLDGQLEGTIAIGAPVPAAGQLSVGNDPDAPNFNGALDEVRVSSVARPADWFAAYAAAARGELVTFSR